MFFIFTGRIAAKRQTAVIKFTHRPKIRFCVPQRRLVAPIRVKLGRTDGDVGPLGCAKFHLNRHRGWECGPKISKIFTFLVKDYILPWPVSKFFTGFYTTNYPTLVFQISCDSPHRLRSYWWEIARQSIRLNFSVHPLGKTMRKMNDTFYDGHDEVYHQAKFEEDRTMCAGCRCENMVFVFCFLLLVTPRVRSTVRSRGAYSSNKHCATRFAKLRSRFCKALTVVRRVCWK